MDALKEFLEGVVPHVTLQFKQDCNDDSSDYGGVEEVPQNHLPTAHEPPTPRTLYEVSLPHDKFNAKAGCFEKATKQFGFRYRTKVSPFRRMQVNRLMH